MLKNVTTRVFNDVKFLNTNLHTTTEEVDDIGAVIQDKPTGAPSITARIKLQMWEDINSIACKNH